MVLMAIMFLQFLLDGGCMAYASVRIHRFLEEAKKTMSRHSGRMHSQMTKVLYGQVSGDNFANGNAKANKLRLPLGTAIFFRR